MWQGQRRVIAIVLHQKTALVKLACPWIKTSGNDKTAIALKKDSPFSIRLGS
jgi:hypothetical protein